ncbi:unnamed protein product [Amoebophrya sp. A25]|nr:unnamed protein product [Amoebophrya sp. A25]|eukprot:GSA25T00025145001.1
MANESAKFMKNAYIGWTSTAGLHYDFNYDAEKVRALNEKEKWRLKREGKWKKQQIEMTMIVPFTFTCETCAEFVYIGKKLNFKMERVRGEYQCGLSIYRFFGKCPHCQSGFTFKTDPKSQGYVMESGGSRAYEHGQTVLEGEKLLEEEKEDAAADKMREIQQAAESAAEQMRVQEALEETMAIQKRAGRDRDMVINQALAALDFLYSAAQDRAILQDEDGSGGAREAETAAEDLEEYLAFMARMQVEADELRNAKIDRELRNFEAGGSAASSSTGGGLESFTGQDLVTEIGPAMEPGTLNKPEKDVFGDAEAADVEKQAVQPKAAQSKGGVNKKPQLRKKRAPLTADAQVRERSPKREEKVKAFSTGYSDSSD